METFLEESLFQKDGRLLLDGRVVDNAPTKGISL